MRVCFHSAHCHAGFSPAGLRRVVILLLLGLIALCGSLFAPTAQAQQTRPDSAQVDTTLRDTTRRDTTRRRPPADSARADSLAPPGARGGPPNDGGPPGEAPGNAVQFSARDSLVIVFGQEGKDGKSKQGDVGTLYGQAEVQQGDATLTAYEVQMLFDRSTLRAVGPPDGLRVDTMALPRFQRGEGKAFTGSKLSFNMETKRGRIVEARTGFKEGYVQGEAVRVDADSTLFIRHGSYTTCNCPRGQTPSYSLRSRKMKVQGKWVYTGPIQLFLYNIPTPLILPFAFLPSTPGRHGGIITPSYGEDNRLGFYLQDFGYYWPISDYMDLQLTGSLWSRGSWGLSPTFRYKRRYYYDGDLRVDYVHNLAGDQVDRDYLNRTDAKIRWTHSQQFVPRGAPNSASLSANVNLASTTYRRAVSDDFQDNVTQKTRSSINFRKRWNDGDQRLAATLGQRQNLTTGLASATLPDLSFNQSNFHPFAQEQHAPGEGEHWYERLQLSYDGALTNEFDFDPLPDSTLVNRGDSSATGIAWYGALFSQDKYRRATGNEDQRFDFGATHRIPLRAPFSLPRYQLNVTPSLSYDEEWFTSTKRIRLETEQRRNEADSLVTDSTNVTREATGFFAAREVSLSVGANTTFYGLFPLRLGPLRGLRHTVEPRLSFSYEPNYYSDFFGRTRSYVDARTGEEVRYDITTGRDVRSSTERRQVGFSLDNTFETKEVHVDSTGAEQEETLRLLTLDARSSYNFAAEERPLADIRVGARFPALRKKYNVSARANFTFSPYAFDGEGRRLNRLVLRDPGLFPAQLTDFNLTLSTDFQGGDQDAQRNDFGRRADVDRSTGGTPQVPDPLPSDIPGRPSLRQGIGQYANFEIPWSLDLDLSYAFTNRAQFEQSRFILNADFDFNLTPRWKVSGTSGYDFDQGELTSTRLNLTRDFDCWQMNFTWTPFGRYQSYSFSLYVKSSTLRDLLNLRLPRSGVKNRFKGALSQVTRSL